MRGDISGLLAQIGCMRVSIGVVSQNSGILLFRSPHYKDVNILGSILGSRFLGHHQLVRLKCVSLCQLLCVFAKSVHSQNQHATDKGSTKTKAFQIYWWVVGSKAI